MMFLEFIKLGFRLTAKRWRYVLLALVLTLLTAYYQKRTGPTHPERVTFQSQLIQLPRTQETNAPAKVELPVNLEAAQPELLYRRYPLQEPYTRLSFQREGNELVALLPIQPSAGKLEYFIETHQDGKVSPLPKKSTVVIRYKDPVPLWILVPHVYCMFAALLVGMWTLIEALMKSDVSRETTKFVLLFFILGGFILGPFVQKFAFGEFWTGFPFCKDVTDNKVLFSIVFWILAWWKNRHEFRRFYIIFAALMMFGMYLVPHSLGGSQFDYKEGKIKTGLQKAP